MFLVDELAVKVRCLRGYLSGSIEPSLVRFEGRIGQQASVRNACLTYHLSPKKYRSYFRRSRLPIEDPILHSFLVLGRLTCRMLSSSRVYEFQQVLE
jgi:hypothetical protein